MQALKITDSVAVCGQILPEQVSQIAEAGFKVLLNNRPDGEEGGQPSGQEIEAAAQEAGLSYYHLPVTAASFPGDDIETMAALFNDESAPVFAFCRTGTRCANLWIATRLRDEREDALSKIHSLGFDISMASRVVT
ncbi:MAG: TIGR01244 family sulfur transferase [Pseudomonadota bacterium]